MRAYMGIDDVLDTDISNASNNPLLRNGLIPCIIDVRIS